MSHNFGTICIILDATLTRTTFNIWHSLYNTVELNYIILTGYHECRVFWVLIWSFYNSSNIEIFCSGKKFEKNKKEDSKDADGRPLIFKNLQYRKLIFNHFFIKSWIIFLFSKYTSFLITQLSHTPYWIISDETSTYKLHHTFIRSILNSPNSQKPSCLLFHPWQHCHCSVCTTAAPASHRSC